MSMTITKNFLTPNQYSRPQTPLKNPTKIVVHYVGNPGSTAVNNRNYFNNAPSFKRYISAHYVVGLEGEVIQCVPEDEIAYCSNQANAYSISIETCHPKEDGVFLPVTEKALAELCADICKRHKLDPIKDIIRHFDVTGKHCPLDYVNHPEKFVAFKERVKSIMASGADLPATPPKVNPPTTPAPESKPTTEQKPTTESKPVPSATSLKVGDRVKPKFGFKIDSFFTKNDVLYVNISTATGKCKINCQASNVTKL